MLSFTSHIFQYPSDYFCSWVVRGQASMWLSAHLPSGWPSSAPLVSPMLPWSSSLKALSLQPPPLHFHLPMSYHLPSHCAPIEGSFLVARLVFQVKDTEQKIEDPQVSKSTQVCLSGPELPQLVLFSQFHPFPWEISWFRLSLQPGNILLCPRHTFLLSIHLMMNI